ncbi:histone PARylation factor 1 isoform X1 [Microcebus murinus]|uniref:Histone PARylation factor 1 n=1 Tax=Microcebus murinus TaxID=30608 RepID=A0A8C5VAE2_MICMU|nr:histone PARylation factor 1 [Microcebus murinus]XP_012626108.1 histone PARylation factor 1 [Microcebus murinus]XP_020135843.1 histone PARylation factor 1 [Microcebus murinus]
MVGGGGKRRSGVEGQQCEKTVDVKKSKSCEADVSSDLRKEVENHYKLSFPEDFYHFWKFCEELDPEKPADSLSASLGLQLVGPYDILAGKHKMKKKSTGLNFKLHWRFYYDPPEFQTIIIGDNKTQYHMGYFRDSPDELPVYVGINEAKKNCMIAQSGDNVFAAVKLFLMKKLKEVTDKKKVNLLKNIDERLTEASRELGYSLEQKTVKMKQRDKKVVTKTFHGAGLVVPVDKNDVGYRELPETDADLKRICKTIVEAASDEERLKAFAPIQEMMTFVQFANDECDYGMGLELGMDLFCYGSPYFHKVAGQLLPLAYNLLKRNLYAEIIEDHLANRSKENIDQLAT